MTESSDTRSLNTHWKLLGELELPVGSNAEGVLDAWLAERVAPLRLHTDFRHKVLRSIRESTRRALQPDSGMRFEHVHVSIFAPHQRASNGQTWGFFRIEKIDGLEHPNEHPDQAVEVYLYLEG